MICVYLVNEEPAYIGMLSFSLKMLRQHNPNASVVVYYIKDGKRDSRKVPIFDILRITNPLNLPNNYDSFAKFCEELNVEVRVRVANEFVNEEESHFSLHRLHLREIEEETILLLDGDTFIFGNFEEFPKIYNGFDFVATTNYWGSFNSVPGLDPNFKSFNSGVVLCQNGTFKKWMDNIQYYCNKLYNHDHPQSDWLWSESRECAGREELAASLFVLDNNLKYRYFEDHHVQTGSHCVVSDTDPCVLHTLTPYWTLFYKKRFRKPKRMLLFKPKL